jgi:hypothetical protein
MGGLGVNVYFDVLRKWNENRAMRRELDELRFSGHAYPIVLGMVIGLLADSILRGVVFTAVIIFAVEIGAGMYSESKQQKRDRA